jgi:hypothetical protein
LKRSTSTLVGLASSVISALRSIVQCLAMASMMRPVDCGFIRLGVPPPKKMDCTTRPGASWAAVAISRS